MAAASAVASAFVGVIVYSSSNALSTSTAALAADVKVLSSQLMELRSTSESQLSHLRSTSQAQYAQLSSKLDSAVRLSGSVERIDKDLTVLLSKK